MLMDKTVGTSSRCGLVKYYSKLIGNETWTPYWCQYSNTTTFAMLKMTPIKAKYLPILRTTLRRPPKSKIKVSKT